MYRYDITTTIKDLIDHINKQKGEIISALPYQDNVLIIWRLNA